MFFYSFFSIKKCSKVIDTATTTTSSIRQINISQPIKKTTTSTTNLIFIRVLCLLFFVLFLFIVSLLFI